MTLRSLLFKPRWQHRDPDIRLAAVRDDDDPQLSAALSTLVRGDDDPRVRLAALRRAGDAGLAQAAACDDPDAGVRTTARTLWLDMLCGSHPKAPSMDERLRLLRAQDDAAVLAHIACHGQESALRSAALERVVDTNLVLERAINDADAALRMAAMERISDEAQLLRLATQARRSDKELIRHARERVLALRIKRGDMETITDQARQLCEQLERLVHDPRDLDRVEADVQRRWEPLAEHVPAELAQRYARASAVLHAMRNPDAMLARRAHAAQLDEIDRALDELQERATADDAAAHADALGQQLTALAQRHLALPTDQPANQARHESIEDRLSHLTSLLAGMAGNPETDPVDTGDVDSAGHEAVPVEGGDGPDAAVAQARFAALVASAHSDVAREREKQTALLADLESAVGQLEQALAAGNSAVAGDSNAQVENLRQAVAAVPRGLTRRLARAQGEYRKIINWQRWSSNERRQQLCTDVEALPEAALHPDALATRLREIQAQWRELGADAPDSLEHRFRRACRRALEPARTYFDKRSELRAEKTTVVTATIAEIEQAMTEAHGSTYAGLRQKAIAALRGLDDVDPRQRGVLARKTRGLLDRLDRSIAEHNAAVAEAKDALIAAAQALTEDGLQRDATRTVRDLQARWKAAGNGARRRDQAQWTAFRKAVDVVFATLDQQRAERNAASEQTHGEAVALCDALQALADSGTDDPAEFARIQREWRALAVRDDDLRERFANAGKQLQEQVAARKRDQANVRFRIWQQRYALLREWESGTAPDLDAWHELPPCTIAAPSFARRLADLQAGTATPPQDEAFRDILLELENEADLESPPADTARRMELRVQQLAQQMSGDQAPPVLERLAAHLVRWLDLGPLPENLAEHDARLASAIDAILART